MYGLVFEIVEEWIIGKQGLEVWHEIKTKAGCQIKDECFLRRAYYRDEELVDIIAAASGILGISVPDILEAFGHYVIMHHFDNGYDDLLRCQGSTLRQWLSNLNAMHDHVQKSFPGENFIAPIFWCEDCDEVDGSILLHYYTLRGTLLVPMVVGIVEELSLYHFEVEIKMDRLTLQDENGAAFTTWRITAVDESQTWKLSPKSNRHHNDTDEVCFDNVTMPSKCPFTGRKLKTESETGDSAAKCPFSERQESNRNSTALLSKDKITDEDCSDEVGLTLQKMKEIFPFHIIVNKDFSIAQVGEKLPTLLKKKVSDLLGVHIGEVVQISRPVLGSSWDWKSLNKLADQNFSLTPKADIKSLHKKVSMSDCVVKFKASMIKVSTDCVMFTLSPDARNVSDLNNMGLTLSDLPLQSCQRDAIFLGEHVTQESDKAHKLDKLSKTLSNEKKLSNTLLYNMLPKQVADDLRKGKTVEPTFHENVTLFFSDIEGFTKICDQVEPWAVIDMMNQLYSVMDFLASHFNLYKVETVGDSYMCCSGLPEPDEYHAENVANFALAVVECTKHIIVPSSKMPINLRIGIHTGSCTSGVVGTMTPHYCLFGDMVNTTSRHESTGKAGKIHCSSTLFGRLQHFAKSDERQYNFKARGMVNMKGKGENYTYWLESSTDQNASAGPRALAELSSQAETMLASKTWKMRKYFRRGSVFHGITSDLSSAENSSTADDSASRRQRSIGDSSAYGSTDRSDDDNMSINSSCSALENDIEIDNFQLRAGGSIIDFTEEQLLHFGKDWKDLVWKDLSQKELVSKIVDVLSSSLKSCIHKGGPRQQLVEEQLREYVQRIVGLYNSDSAYHNFQRAAQTFLRAVFLWESRDDDEHQGSYSLGSDPWDRFILLFSALIHGFDHLGVTNAQLEVENHLLCQMYKANGSAYQQQRSVDHAFQILDDDFFGELYEEIVFGCPTFRRSVRKVVLSTDMESKDRLLAMLENIDRISAQPANDERACRQQNETNIGLILAMATIGQYSQGYDMFLDWNLLQFQENLHAFKPGHSEDPQDSWYYEQCTYFKDAVVPLVNRIHQVLPKATYLVEGVKKNIVLWRQGGRQWLAAAMLPKATARGTAENSVDQIEKLISANVEILENLLKDVAASHKMKRALGNLDKMSERKTNPYDEIQLVIEMKNENPTKAGSFEPSPELSTEVRYELRGFVQTIAEGYKNNGFHNFAHASHVSHLANLLVKGIHVTEGSHDGSGIAHDPLARFAIVLSALVHDVGHTGVPNDRFAEEKPDLANKYRNKSIAEQNSIDTAWDILMADCFRNLQHCLFESVEERSRMRQLLVNCVMATDIFDKDLRAIRKSRWEKVFAEDVSLSSDEEEAHCKATIVIEHIMQASDVAHTMQDWEIYRQWNESLFHEMYEAYTDGRADKDPLEGWYKGELWFFDNWVIPLARDLKECGVLDIVSDQLVKQAQSNLRQWEMEGEEICRELARSSKREVRSASSSSVYSRSLSIAGTTCTRSESILASRMVTEVESLSKVVKRYERKMEAACGNLIAVAYKGQPAGQELKTQSWTSIHEHFKELNWYRMYSDDEAFSEDDSSGNANSRVSSHGGSQIARNIQIIMDDINI